MDSPVAFTTVTDQVLAAKKRKFQLIYILYSQVCVIKLKI